MVNEEEVREKLEEVLVPAANRSVVGLNLLREIAISNGKVDITLASSGLIPGAQAWIKARITEAVKELPGVTEVGVEYVNAKAGDLNAVGHVIAVMSGKGGVGKSLVSSLLALALKRQGYEVGILDADITGPSIPRMFGIKVPPSGNEDGILPVSSKLGIEVMSINLILPSEDEAVIWRGPLVGKAISQFWEEVLWGKLDYLIVDLPPGTADAPLTVLQQIPVSGVIIVFTPQSLVEMIVRKAVNMAQHMEKRILGIVENMSYLHVPDVDKKVELFGPSRGEELAKSIGAPLLAQIPLDPELAKLCDEGGIEAYEAEVVSKLGDSLLQVLPARVDAPESSS